MLRFQFELVSGFELLAPSPVVNLRRRIQRSSTTDHQAALTEATAAIHIVASTTLSLSLFGTTSGHY